MDLNGCLLLSASGESDEEDDVAGANFLVGPGGADLGIGGISILDADTGPFGPFGDTTGLSSRLLAPRLLVGLRLEGKRFGAALPPNTGDKAVLSIFECASENSFGII